MKKFLTILVVLAAWYGLEQYRDVPSSSGPVAASAETALQEAFARQQSDVAVQGGGTVVRILRDDLEGSRHQRFIVELGSGQTVLVSHNIDLAPRVEELRRGDRIEFSGEYEWNEQGGVVHWTHHDPAGRHSGGWLRHGGRTYR